MECKPCWTTTLFLWLPALCSTLLFLSVFLNNPALQVSLSLTEIWFPSERHEDQRLHKFPWLLQCFLSIPHFKMWFFLYTWACRLTFQNLLFCHVCLTLKRHLKYFFSVMNSPFHLFLRKLKSFSSPCKEFSLVFK